MNWIRGEKNERPGWKWVDAEAFLFAADLMEIRELTFAGVKKNVEAFECKFLTARLVVLKSLFD